MRDRLIELLNKARCKEVYTTSDGEPVTKINRRIVDMYEVNILADYLLADGWIRLPCKIGDEIKGEIVCAIEYYKSLKPNDETHTITKIHTCDKDDVGKKVFCSHSMTWEEAEQALKGGVQE